MWPNSAYAPNIVIYNFALESIGVPLVNSGATSLNGTASATFSANSAIFVPFSLSTRATFQNMFWLNGATVNGNVDVGVYTPDGTRLWSAGSTAQVNINTLQSVAISPTLQLGPGVYYLALATDSATATFFRASATNTTYMQAVFGLGIKSAAMPLPATVTMATFNSGSVPLVTITTRSFV